MLFCRPFCCPIYFKLPAFKSLEMPIFFILVARGAQWFFYAQNSGVWLFLSILGRWVRNIFPEYFLRIPEIQLNSSFIVGGFYYIRTRCNWQDFCGLRIQCEKICQIFVQKEGRVNKICFAKVLEKEMWGNRTELIGKIWNYGIWKLAFQYTSLCYRGKPWNPKITSFHRTV